MYSKKELIEKLNAYLKNKSTFLTKEEVTFLEALEDKLKKSNKIESQLKWAYELLRFINLFKDFI